MGVAASGREAAAFGEVGHVGRLAADGSQAGVAAMLNLGDGFKQGLGVGVAHTGEEVGGGCLFHDAPGIHHGNFVGSARNHAEVVSDEDHRHLLVCLEAV